jgi:protein involved in polysaccharide export with SLBB domain
LNLILEEFTRPYVVVAGEVAKPGQFEIRDNMTALSAILMAGGFTQSAKSGQVIVFRKVNDTIDEVKELNLTSIHKTASSNTTWRSSQETWFWCRMTKSPGCSTICRRRTSECS